MSNLFIESEKPVITVMVQAETPAAIKSLTDKAMPLGAEAFGMQFEQMLPQYRSREVYTELFGYKSDVPTYATNYRSAQNEGKPDEILAQEILELADCGAELCDVMGDYFDRQPDEMARDSAAIEKQKALIEGLHQKGAKVLMSSHIYKFTPAERVLEIALEQQNRGADICKIVTGAENTEQQLENLKIADMLKRELKIPFLFLSTGECDILRRIGGRLGCCMYLCVCEHDRFSTPQQPLLKDIKLLRDIW